MSKFIKSVTDLFLKINTFTDAARSNVDAKRIKVDDEDEGEELAISVRLESHASHLPYTTCRLKIYIMV